MRTWMTMAVLLAVAACASSPEDERPSGGFSVADQVGDWSADLRPVNESGVSGEVKVQSALAAMGVTISISGATSGGHHPWHVHRGTCGSGGAIVGDAGAYPPLHVDADGTARAAVTVGTPLHEQERYHVNVHRSPSELNVIIACGDLSN